MRTCLRFLLLHYVIPPLRLRPSFSSPAYSSPANSAIPQRVANTADSTGHHMHAVQDYSKSPISVLIEIIYATFC